MSKVKHLVCDGCGECFEDNFTDYGVHLRECDEYKNLSGVEDCSCKSRYGYTCDECKKLEKGEGL